MVDFSKAFDTIQPSLLLKKLRKYGFEENIVQLIKSYLSNRKQYVFLDGIKSKKINSPSIGTPQGSCISPLLYLIYINCFNPDTKFLLFADDTAIIFYGESIAELENNIRKGLNYCEEYFLENRLTINTKKTYYLTNANIQPPKINEQEIIPINEENHFKYLGIELAGFPKFSNHTNHLINKLQAGIITLEKLKSTVTFECLREVYFAFIQSYILYSLSTWGTLANKQDMNSIFTMQKKAIRIVFKKRRKVHTSNLFKEGQILKLNDLLKLSQTMEGYNGLIKKSHDVYLENCKIRGGHLRNKNNWISVLTIFDKYCIATNEGVQENLFEKILLPKNRGLILPSRQCVRNRFKEKIFPTYVFNCTTPNCYVCT